MHLTHYIPELVSGAVFCRHCVSQHRAVMVRIKDCLRRSGVTRIMIKIVGLLLFDCMGFISL